MRPQTLRYTEEAVANRWLELHLSDQEPQPSDQTALEIWTQFHNGMFMQLAELNLGPHALHNNISCVTAIVRAKCVLLTHIDNSLDQKIKRLNEIIEVVDQAGPLCTSNVNLHHLKAYAIGRYIQITGVMPAFKQGLISDLHRQLEALTSTAPLHTELVVTKGVFHTEVIDKIGCLIGKMTFGSTKALCQELFQQALRQAPNSRIARIEYARSLPILEKSECAEHQARILYAQAIQLPHIDAADELDQIRASAELTCFE